MLLAVLPMFFGGRIAQRVQTEINARVNAHVAWRDAGLSFFRRFPNLSLTLDDLSAVGAGPFQGDTLAAVSHLRVVLDLFSVLGNVTHGAPLVIRAIELDQPRLHMIVLADGTANWDITKAAPAPAPAPAAAGKSAAAGSSALAVSLRKFQISDAKLVFENHHSNLTALLVGYSQTLSGDFSLNHVTLQTNASADTANVVFAGVPYLHHVRLGLAANIDADFAARTYTLQSTELHLNDLTLGAAGTVKSVGDNLGLDVTFKAPGSDFRSLLSLVPAVYAHDFAKLQTSGAITVNGWVKGDYGKSAFPSFSVQATVDNAGFKYPDLPLAARAIAMNLAITNPGGSPDRTLVKLDRFHVLLGNNPIDAHMTVSTPVSDPNVDAAVSGTLNLADLARTVKLDGVDQLAGTIATNATLQTRMSYITKKQYDRVKASGSVNVSGLTVKGAALQNPVAIQQAALTLSPARAQLKSFNATIGSSDVQASGTLNNLLGFVLESDTLSGSATVHSKRFNLNEWKSDTTALEIIPVPPRIDLTLDATADQVLYGKLTLAGVRTHLQIKDERVTLQPFQANTLNGQIGMTGYYETINLAKPTFSVGLTLTNVDIPSAFQAIATIQALAPAAEHAHGNVSSTFTLAGGLGKNMLPLMSGLTGSGAFQTSQLVMQDYPPLQKVADVTKLQFLNNPTVQPLKASFEIHDGRMYLKPFTMNIGGTAMTVSGSNGLDQSLAYTMDMQVPRALLGGSANAAPAGVMSKAQKAGVNLEAGSTLPLAVKIGGTVTSPTVSTDLSSAAASVASTAKTAATQAATKQASAEATKLVQQAQERADSIKKDAQAVAAKMKQVGYAQADSLVAKAGSNPLAQVAAKAAASKLRKETDDKAAALVNAANQRADSVVAAARRQADKVGGGWSSPDLTDTGFTLRPHAAAIPSHGSVHSAFRSQQG